MSKLKNIKKSVSTDFSNFLNQYYAFLKRSEEQYFVMDSNKVKNEIIQLINTLDNEKITRVPYDSITSKVNEFCEKIGSDNIDGLDESFSFLLEKSSEILESIIDDFISPPLEQDSSKENNSRENAIYAFYKVVEHTKLAYVQYQSLYHKTEQEVLTIQKDIESWSESTAEILSDSYTKVEDINSEIKSLEGKYSKLNIDIISVLGIFASIIFAVFGGVSQLGALGGALNETSLGKILIFIGGSSFVLFSVVFLAFYTTALLTGKDMRVCECRYKVSDNKKCTHSICEKYPIYVIMTTITILIFIMGICIEKN
ncbi:hypothetical protein JavanS54_0008 [Streptococcus satellite phage Javan54]|uniref:hypothetical protein n=1 Tax=Streptococcus agalactiae TaxID=1311 RepID=UPI000332E657|nr:hypothetical protein [Streptococcus agalactiae]QBX11065.1 hypothetical protein JavanS54_0008 [Streptococcus satellite phage Javan54]CCW41048.1 hypothetical protein MSA_21940 [Streptococcus agalactiae ILRI005]